MSKFGDDLRKFAKKTGITMDTAFRGIVTELFSSVILATPVDTGRARANWLPTVNTYNATPTNKVDPSGMNTVGLVNALNFKMGDIVYLTNSLPYIHRLEYEGWSKQAPNGMVRINMARIRSIVANAVRDAK